MCLLQILIFSTCRIISYKFTYNRNNYSIYSLYLFNFSNPQNIVNCLNNQTFYLYICPANQKSCL